MQGISYSVDLVLCIDATGSMAPIIERVKDRALTFYRDMQEALQTVGKIVDPLRVGVVVFRDFYVDGKNALKTSDFLTLPAENGKLDAFVREIKADGGGDVPENGLEALAVAIASPWSTSGTRRRQIIVVWTDTNTHDLSKDGGSKPELYPSHLPRTFDALTDMWQGQDYVSQTAKRLILFAPDTEPWSEMGLHWENVIHHPSTAGDGLSDVDYGTILDTIVRSIS